MDHLAPILLFVYNRPIHTLKTLNALKNNQLAEDSELIIYADGPKIVTDVEERNRINDVRNQIKEISGFRSVSIYEREKNLGLAKSIIDGVTDTLQKYGKAIVLEDDVLTSSGFLKYMNEALDLYEKEEKVMHISGYMFPVRDNLPPTFFLNTASCWGWATWQRAWKHIILDPKYLISKIYQQKLIPKINLNGAHDHFSQLVANREGTLKTWAIFWHTSIILNDGYCLHPYPSLTHNIGHDQSGINSQMTNSFGWKRLIEELPVEKIEINEYEPALKALSRFYDTKQSRPMTRIIGDWAYSNLKGELLNRTKSLFSKESRRKLRGYRFLKKYPRYKHGRMNLLNPNFNFVDSDSALFMYDEIFGHDVYKFVANSDSPLILDCGANIGLSTIYFKQLYPNARLISFEPDKEIFDVLKSNIFAMHKLNNVTLVNSALWWHEEGANFENEGADAGKILLKNTKIKVRTCKLSSYLNDKVDFLKMDIEGAEYEVLKESGEKLKNVRQMFIEYHSFEDRSHKLHQILELLTNLNFRYYLTMPGLKSANPLLRLNKYAGMDMQVNIYAKNLS